MADLAPHVERGAKEINARFPQLGKAGTYPGHGEDGPQYATDFWSTDKAVHDRVFPWLRANAVRLGIKYIISWEQIWSVERAAEGVRPYNRYDDTPNPTASQLHKNHIHVSWNVEPPAAEEPETIGAPIMADAEDVRVTFHDDQPLAQDKPGWIHKNADKGTSVVEGAAKGVDVEAVVEFGGLKADEFVRIWWQQVWKKTGAENQLKGAELKQPAIPYGRPDSADGWTAKASYKGPLKKADAGWTPCLRLMYETNSGTAFKARLTVRGWEVPA